MNGTTTNSVTTPCGDASLSLPPRIRGIVVIVDAGGVMPGGAAESAWESGHRLIASALQEASFATLRVNLLLPSERAEDVAPKLRFDISLLASRLGLATDWLSTVRALSGQPVGFFGAGMGAAAALQLAAQRSDVRAVVSRAGRVDLVITHLDRVAAPTLLLVGATDEPMQRVTRQAFAALRCTKEMILVPGAGHLFDEAGSMAHVAAAATTWLARHLAFPATGGS
jgi:dienelactone hydrolase